LKFEINFIANLQYTRYIVAPKTARPKDVLYLPAYNHTVPLTNIRMLFGTRSRQFRLYIELHGKLFLNYLLLQLRLQLKDWIDDFD